MGFKKSWDVADIERQLRTCASEASSPYNDGWTAMYCKRDLYRIKCLIEDIYHDLPKFAGEEEWEQERLVELLSR